MAHNKETLSCPFCDFVDIDEYFLMQHVELIHPENGESPFIVQDTEVSDQGLGSTSLRTIEEAPTTNGNPFPPRSEEPQRYVPCPQGCGEYILSAELSVHADLHMAESMAFEEGGLSTSIELSTGPCNDEQALVDMSNAFSTSIPKSLRNYDQLGSSSAPNTPRRRRTSLRDLFFGSPTTQKSPKSTAGTIRRLGRAELGPYAHEKQMPMWLRRMLEEGAKVTLTNQIGANGTIVRVEAIANETPDLVPVLAHLSQLDQTVDQAFYCSPAVHHVSKMPKEGGFCGYRNIQMLVSYMRTAQSPGHEYFSDHKLPSILRLQDMIEQAWDMGFNPAGRIETGGIRLTRKYIGTPEAQALFASLDIPCEANAIVRNTELEAYENLLLAVLDYFRAATPVINGLPAASEPNSSSDATSPPEKVILTDRPPIYFQHRGHSMTIVGLEVRHDGAINLVVFDPMFQPNPTIKRLAIGTNSGVYSKTGPSWRVIEPGRLMKAHRRGESYLGKYRDFELLKLAG